MGDDAGENVIDRPKLSGKFSLRDMLAADHSPETPSGWQEADAKGTHSPLPGLGADYKAHAQVNSQPEVTLRLVLGNGTIRGLAYANLDSIDWQEPDTPGGEPAIILLFMGAMPAEVVISGRNLMQLFDYLGDHRIRWVRQMPKGRDFAEAGEAVVTSIEFRQPQVRL